MAPSSSISIDDALVIRAVVEHTILPQVPRSGGGVVARIEDLRKLPCTGRPSRDTPCRIPDHWQQFRVPNPRGWPGLIENDQQRKELVASLEERNTLGHPLPKIDHPQVVLIPVDRRTEARQHNRSVVIVAGLFRRWAARAHVWHVYVWEPVWLWLGVRAGENRWLVASAERRRNGHQLNLLRRNFLIPISLRLLAPAYFTTTELSAMRPRSSLVVILWIPRSERPHQRGLRRRRPDDAPGDLPFDSAG